MSEADLDLFPRVVPIEGLDDDPVAIENGFRVTQELPLLIRERDLDYQHSRLTLFRRLLRGYPFTRDRVLREAIVDIPGVVRSQVWSVILEVPHDIDEAYKRIDKESPGPTDHQLAVDIPRCHQYDPLLSSPAGHAKFRRVLKTWILSNPDLVYWQGLDSVCAPFLVNSFQNESIVFGCLHSFVRRYLGHFFLKDNSQTMQECLAIFVHMICYHDPELGYGVLASLTSENQSNTRHLQVSHALDRIHPRPVRNPLVSHLLCSRVPPGQDNAHLGQLDS